MKLLNCFFIFIVASSFLYSQKWENCNSNFEGASIYTMAFNGNNIYASTQTSGIHLSTDNGATWNNVRKGLTEVNITSVKVINNIVIASTFNDGIFISKDNCATWTQCDSLKRKQFYALETNSTGIFASVYDGIYSSFDFGKTWNLIPTTIKLSSVENIVSNDSLLFVSNDKGKIYKYNLKTSKWDSLSVPFTQAIKTMKLVDSNLYVVCGYGLYKSSYIKENWIELNTFSRYGGLVIDKQNIYLINSQNNITFSNDNGKTWKDLVLTNSAASIINLFYNNNILWKSYSNLGLEKSSDSGAKWQKASKGLHDINIRFLNSDGSNLYTSNTYGIFSSSNSVFDWKYNDSLFTQHLLSSIIFDGNDTYVNVYSFSYDVGNSDLHCIYKSNDKGKTWKANDDGIANKIINSFMIADTFLLAGTDGAIYRKGKNELTWQNVFQTSVYDLYKFQNFIFAGTNKGCIRSNDNGASWTQMDTSLQLNVFTKITSINNNLYASVSNGFKFVYPFTTGKKSGLYKSTDSGLTWNIGKNKMDSIISNNVIASGTSLFFAYSGVGVFEMPNESGNWLLYGDSLNFPEYTLFKKLENSFYVGTRGFGLYRLPFNNLDIENNNTLNEINLYPNPSNNYINFENDDIESVYYISNILGSKMKTGIAKSHNRIDISDMPNGKYFLNINSNIYSFIKN